MLPATDTLLRWLVLWLAAWGAALLLLGHTAPLAAVIPRTVLTIFPAAAVGAFLLFPEERRMWLAKIDWVHIAIIAAGAMVLYAARSGSSSSGFLFVTEHVLFQQIMLALLIFMRSASLKEVSLRVLVFFGLSHVLLVFFMPIPWALFFAVFSLPGGILFALLIEKARYGIGVSAFVHLLFYAALVQFL